MSQVNDQDESMQESLEYSHTHYHLGMHCGAYLFTSLTSFWDRLAHEYLGVQGLSTDVACANETAFCLFIW